MGAKEGWGSWWGARLWAEEMTCTLRTGSSILDLECLYCKPPHSLKTTGKLLKKSGSCMPAHVCLLFNFFINTIYCLWNTLLKCLLKCK